MSRSSKVFSIENSGELYY